MRKSNPKEDELGQAQSRLLAVWKEKQLAGRRLLAYDTTNFYTLGAARTPEQTSAAGTQ